MPVRFLLPLLLACRLAAADHDVRSFGAKGDGTTLDTAAIQKAIEAAADGGGRVVFPPGRYLSGTIHLKSRVTLHLLKDATLVGSTDLKLYQRLNFLGLILANQQSHIGISGEGVIDGQGKAIATPLFTPIKGGSTPDAGESKRPVLINFRNCTNVHVRGITLRESACWVQLYRDCEQVLIENVKVRTLAAITNDGLDIDGCSKVTIRGCDIDSEDDGICLKSSRRFCEDVLIENCRVRSSCNAFKLGTASHAGFRRITVRNLTIHDTYLSGIALQSVDCGTLEDVRISGVTMTDTNNPLFIRLGHRNPSKPPGIVRNIQIHNVRAHIPNRPRSAMNKFPPYWRHQCTTLITGSITGLPGHPIRDVSLADISLTYGGIGAKPGPGHHRIDRLDQIPECAGNYPESKMFGVLPAWGLYCRHVDGLTLERLNLSTQRPDYRPALVFDDVARLTLKQGSLETKGSPAIVLKNVPKASIIGTEPPGSPANWILRIDEREKAKR